MKAFLIKKFFPMWYRLCCIKRAKKRVVFIEVRETKVTSNFIPLISMFKEKNPEYKIRICFLKLGRVSKLSYFIRCFRMLSVLAGCRYAFINDSSNIIAAIKLRKATTLIQTWHGCGALKKFGYSTGQHEKYYGNETIVTVSAPEVIPAFHEAMGVPDENIYPIGLPRTDIFFQENWKNKCSSLKNEVLKGQKKKIILYAPTFRGNVANAKDPQGLNIDLMYKALSQEYIMLTKFHSALPASKADYRHSGFLFDVTDTMTIEDAMGICDILVTDYSSLIFEYALLNKPAIFYACDLDKYVEERGFFLDYKKEMPGRICDNTKDVIYEIKNGAYDSIQMGQFREKYMSGCDGHSTLKLYNLIMNE